MTPDLRLTADERGVDVWLTFYRDIVDEGLLTSLRELLSDAEQRQEARFYFADDRKRYLITRAMVRSVLSSYAAVAPVDWTFSTNSYGCPRIEDKHIAAMGISFNVSHTRGLIALGVARGRALGIDVENIAIRQVSTDLADSFFAPDEVDELAALPLDQRRDRFFEYWTFKESYIKARGMGLSIPLDKFSFCFPHERAVCMAIQPDLDDDAERWSFRQYRPTPDYLLALCVERRGNVTPCVTIRKTIPTVAYEAFESPTLRVTQAPSSTAMTAKSID